MTANIHGISWFDIITPCTLLEERRTVRKAGSRARNEHSGFLRTQRQRCGKHHGEFDLFTYFACTVNRVRRCSKGEKTNLSCVSCTLQNASIRLSPSLALAPTLHIRPSRTPLPDLMKSRSALLCPGHKRNVLGGSQDPNRPPLATFRTNLRLSFNVGWSYPSRG